MKTTLDPWNIIGWLLLGTAGLAVAAVILSLLVMWQRHLLTQYLIRRDWRRTRHVAQPAIPGEIQLWGYKHGAGLQKINLRRQEDGTVGPFYFPGLGFGFYSEEHWNAKRYRDRLTLISDVKEPVP